MHCAYKWGPEITKELLIQQITSFLSWFEYFISLMPHSLQASRV